MQWFNTGFASIVMLFSGWTVRSFDDDAKDEREGGSVPASAASAF